MALLVLGLETALGPGHALAQRAMGIDVYSGHGYITWTSVKNAGYTWAWAKATEGTGFQDSQFVNNMNNAKAAGVLIGPYHYARYDLGNSGAAEANWFWSVVRPYLKNDGTCIMPMLDVEQDTTLTQAQVSAWVIDFCQTFIAKATAAGLNVKMVIYTYPWYSNTYLNTSVTHTYLLDMANTDTGQEPQTGAPYLGTWPTWSAWQYSWTIKVPGVPGDANGFCLMDVYNGTLAQMKSSFVIGGSPPVITNQPVSLVCTQGNTATFTVVAGPSPLNYQWRKNGSNLSNDGRISGATTATLNIANLTTNDAAGYSVVLTNNFGALTSAVATLTVYVPPSIVTQPQSQTIVQGTTNATTFSIAATGTAPLTYRWQSSTRVYGPGTNNTSFTITPTKSDNYSCIVSNAAGVVTSAVATLTVLVPPGILTQPESQTNLAGSSVTFSLTASGTPPLTYQWQSETRSYAPGTNNASFSTSKAGSYWCIVTNFAGAITSAVATAVFTNPPAQPGQFAGIRLLADGSVQLDMSGTADTNYVLECTSNWVDWADLSTLSDSNGLFQYTEPAATNGSQRFYRLRLGP